MYLNPKISDKKYQEFLRYKSGKSINLGQFSSMPSVSTACFFQSVEGHSPWILDSGASHHIFDNIFSFSPISSSEYPHLVTIAMDQK